MGEMTMIGMHLPGGVGGLLSRMTGETDSEMISSSSPMRLSIGISHHGMGVKILGGCCWSGVPSSGLVGVVATVGAVWGASTPRSDL